MKKRKITRERYASFGIQDQRPLKKFSPHFPDRMNQGNSFSGRPFHSNHSRSKYQGSSPRSYDNFSDQFNQYSQRNGSSFEKRGRNHIDRNERYSPSNQKYNKKKSYNQYNSSQNNSFKSNRNERSNYPFKQKKDGNCRLVKDIAFK